MLSYVHANHHAAVKSNMFLVVGCQ